MSQSMTVSEAGKRGNERRWADHAPVRAYIGDLSNEQRKLIWAAIRAERAKAQERERADQGAP